MRIAKEFQFTVEELEILRHRDVIVLRPHRSRLSEAQKYLQDSQNNTWRYFIHLLPLFRFPTILSPKKTSFAHPHTLSDHQASNTNQITAITDALQDMQNQISTRAITKVD